MKGKQFGALLAVVGLLVLNLFFFGVFTLFTENRGEFQLSLREIWAHLLPAATAAAVLLVVPGVVLRDLWRKRYLAVLLLAGVATYVHGNLLVWDTGVLDGSQLDFSNSAALVIDGALWVIGLVVALRFAAPLSKQAGFVAVCLLVLQSAGVAIRSPDAGAPVPEHASATFPPELAMLSSQQNVLHIVLDGFQADFFRELLESEPELAARFEGFTYFSNALTSSAVTYLSVPAFLSGKTFTNEQKITEYHAETLGGENVLTALDRAGYNIDIATPVWWNAATDAMDQYYRIPTPYLDYPNAQAATAWFLLDLSVFRQAPFFLKPPIYDDQSWLLSDVFSSDPSMQFQHFSHTTFLRDLTQELVVVDRPEPVYKSLHLITPHAPLVTRQDCTAAGAALPDQREHHLWQSRCLLEDLLGLLDRMQELAVYQSSLIVIHADHGSSASFAMRRSDGTAVDSTKSELGLWGAPLPLMLVKRAGDSGPLVESTAPITLTDLPATLAAELNLPPSFPGPSMFDLDPEATRERMYYYSYVHRNDAAAKDFFDFYESYVVRGNVYEESSWSRGQSAAASALEDRLPYRWGEAIRFGQLGNSKPYQVKGWSRSTGDHITWTEGSSAELTVDIPEPGQPVTLVVDANPYLSPPRLPSQNVRVLVNGEAVGSWQFTEAEFQVSRMAIPASAITRQAPAAIRFEFPDARSPSSLGAGKDLRELGLAFRTVSFEAEVDASADAGAQRGVQ
ncbi:MAG: sulfatase-like hydrolase/transferase [Pseudomonadota bacterium]